MNFQHICSLEDATSSACGYETTHKHTKTKKKSEKRKMKEQRSKEKKKHMINRIPETEPEETDKWEDEEIEWRKLCYNAISEMSKLFDYYDKIICMY
jgi:hypothetical protein